MATDLRNDGAIRHLVARTVERFGRIDVLVNNSGIAGPTKPCGMSMSANGTTRLFSTSGAGFIVRVQCCRQ